MAKKQIHSSIKVALGFDKDMPDKEFKATWKNKANQVCKPCWELKYCPYGPFVEQSPLLPSLREGAIEHNEYLKHCLENDTVGSVNLLSDEQIEKKKEELEVIEEHPYFLLPEIFRELNHEELIKDGERDDAEISDIYQTPFANFETYQVPYPLNEDEDEKLNRILEEIKQIEITQELQERIDEKILQLKQTIATGKADYRKPLDKVRRKSFEKWVKEFDADKHPTFIPEEISEMSCNIFGHICPVVFVGESITETSEKRRKGRYISFKTKIRVVRRDNYTCQECSKHLRDDEVEFDHIIPFSKGGSSEEHNIRLTCYDCNRDKTNKVKI
jgi:hypothetical protein